MVGRFLLVGALHTGAGPFVPSLPQIDDAVEVIPLRIVHSDAVENCCGCAQIVVTDQGSHARKPGRIGAAISGVSRIPFASVGCAGALCRSLPLADELIGAIDLLELLLRHLFERPIGISIRVILLDQRQIGCSDFLLGGALAHAEHSKGIHARLLSAARASARRSQGAECYPAARRVHAVRSDPAPCPLHPATC